MKFEFSGSLFSGNFTYRFPDLLKIPIPLCNLPNFPPEVQHSINFSIENPTKIDYKNLSNSITTH